jgi:hypothetical protein
MSKAQLDMFATQADVIPKEPQSYSPNPDRVRGKLSSVLGELQDAAVMPWDRKTLRYHELVFPQMTGALPAAEARHFRDAFAQELQRLTALRP